MRKYYLFSALIISLLIFNCGDGDDSGNTVYKQYMRSFVQDISTWAKTQSPGFIIIPQNGHELATAEGNEDDPPCMEYINAVDGAGQEDLFYGYNYDNVATPAAERNYLLNFLNLYENNGVEVLVIDYCWGTENINDSYEQSSSRGFISIATTRGLDSIPAHPINDVNDSNITSLSEARNFLYLLDPTENFTSENDFISELDSTNYDVFIIDLFYVDDEEFSPVNIAELQTKPGDSTRLVICYMSIGEAEDYRYYWEDSWETNPPSWLREENPEWEGNYKVEYWDPEWQAIIYGNSGSYLQKIIDAGFDGVYLDIIDAFEYFE